MLPVTSTRTSPAAPSAEDGPAPGRRGQSNGHQAAIDAQPTDPARREADATLRFLIECYRFVTKLWPRAPKEQGGDQGFERRFREYVRGLPNWQASDERELHLGAGLHAASGTTHEVDLVALHPDVRVVVEMKNWAKPVDKNDVIAFFAKVLDYFLANPRLALDGICLAFVCRATFDARPLAACLGLGVHPIGSNIRPLPVLAKTVDILFREVGRGLALPGDVGFRLDDLRAEVANLSVGLKDTWPDDRLDYRSETMLSIRAVSTPDVDGLADRLIRANSTCTDILQAARRAQEGVTP